MIRRHRLQQLRPAVQHADAGWTKHLVRREGKEVAVERLHVDGHVRHRLRRVHQHHRARLPGQCRQFRHRVDDAQHVRRVDRGDDLRAAVDKPLGGRHVEAAVIAHRDVAKFRAGLLSELLPRNDVRVVLHGRRDDVVAGLQVRPSPGLSDEVDRLAGVPRPDDRLRTRGVDEPLHLRPREFVHVGRLDAQRVDAAVDIGVVLLVEVHKRVDHLARLLRGGRIIEVDERPPVDLPLQYGEVLPYARYVQQVRLPFSGAPQKAPAGAGR